jgi:hypothetical protein
MLRPVRIGVVALSVLAMAVLLILALGRSAPRYAGHNDIRESTVAITVPVRAQVCQPSQTIPADAAFVELTGQPLRGTELPAMEVTLRDGERVLGRGRLPAGAATGRVRVEVPTVRRTVLPGTVCVRNLGPGGLGLVGAPDAEGGVKVDGDTTKGLARISYVRSGSESWFDMLGVLAHRFSLAKANWVGAWTFWVLVLLMGVVLAISVRIALAPVEERS